ncbi:hypothetical protein OF855_24630 [Mycolicibacterium fortuitum]|uniref:hypothetical protein n=1 Tax=Mycolicibacterium fortuitum TaxID=1766 RepID=UPI0022BA6A4F|nr:hypothetical protein [Mycolicibacterium fortuitum]WAY18427.1 hypothetical protein OF855_24630 [Mycolicibacterium fortuitum]
MSAVSEFREGQRVQVLDGGQRTATVVRDGRFPFVTVEFDDLQHYGKIKDRIAVVETWRITPITDEHLFEVAP